MYDMYFEVAVQLSDRYRGLDPIKIRNTPAHEIYLLYSRTLKRDMRQGTQAMPKTNKNVIRKKAGDDWF